MVESAGLPDIRVNPSMDNFQDEERILPGHPCVGDPAFETGEAVVEQGSGDRFRRAARESEFAEFIDLGSGRVAAAHDLLCDLLGRYVQDTLFGCQKERVRMAPVTDDTANQGWLELQHGVPRHRHDVGL